MGHDPMYWSNKQYSHQARFPDLRTDLLKESLEEFWHRYRVDIYLNGHVHAYERTIPIYRNTSNSCGTVYITAGDGGNYEGKQSDWVFATVQFETSKPCELIGFLIAMFKNAMKSSGFSNMMIDNPMKWFWGLNVSSPYGMDTSHIKARYRYIEIDSNMDRYR